MTAAVSNLAKFGLLLGVVVVFKMYKIVTKYNWADKILHPPLTFLLGHLDRAGVGYKPSQFTLRTSMEFKKNWVLRLSYLDCFYIVCRPEAMAQVLKSDAPKSHFYSMFLPWLGNGLLLNTGADWKVKRRMLTPSFHFDVLKEWHQIFCRNIILFLDLLKKASARDEALDMQMESSMLSLDNIGETAMGISFGCLNNRQNDFLLATMRASRLSMERGMNPILDSDFVYSFTAASKEFNKAVDVLHAYSNGAIEKRRKELASGDDAARKKFFMDILITGEKDDGSQLTQEEIRAETDTFMFEGHDTTSSGIMWILYDLATNKECQQKVFEELQKEFGAGMPMSWSPPYDLVASGLPYMTKCILESNRLHPPVPSIGREAQEDMQFGDDFVPKGSSLSTYIFGLHMQEDIFPNPTRFDPNRFSDEERAKRGPYDYVPFSAGPRQNFAMLEMRAVAAMTVYHFEVSAVSEPKPYEEMVLRNEGPLLMKFKMRSEQE